MGKKKRNRGEWTWEKTTETQKAIEKLHDDIRRKVKEEDDKFGYDTSGK
jgi:hypothetical protein